MNTDLFIQWLYHFQNNVKATETDSVLLVLDSHISYCSQEAMLFCRDPHNFVKHSTQCIKQDSASGLWLFWALEIGLHIRIDDAFIVNHANQPITLRNVTGLFKRMYLRVAKLDKT
jgi:hypothetical protein